VIIPNDGYYLGVRELCTKYNVLMITDEVQCGMGRTGYLRATQYESIRPDIMCLAKSLGGGYYPISAILADADVMGVLGMGSHGSTYSGSPLASTVGMKAIETLVGEGMVENSRDKGAYLLQELRRMKPHWVKEIRGRGMWFASEPYEHSNVTGTEIALAMLEKGMLAYKGGGGICRMSPPLIMTQENCDEMLEKTISALSGF
jgi:ornithine--oxo-acid transaminase